MATAPNAGRVYDAVVRILERRYGVKIQYILKNV